MNQLIFWKSLVVTPLIGLLVTACNQPAGPSTLNPARYPTPTPITPDLVFQHVGYTEADVPYAIHAKIRNISGCATTTWEVDAPDTLTEGTLGCDQEVIFAASSTETHEVRVSTVNYLGKVVTKTAKVFVPRPGNTMSDYPIISDPVLESHDFDAVSGGCVTSPVGNVVWFDLFKLGCGSNQSHYTASVTVVNPTNQVIWFDWTLYAPGGEGYSYYYSQDGKLDFPLINNFCDRNRNPNLPNGCDPAISTPCYVQLDVYPYPGGKPLPHGNIHNSIWQGRCVWF
jgi:hypothetical protein